MKKMLMLMALGLGLSGMAGAAEPALTQTKMGYAGKDKDYTYGVIASNKGNVIGDNFILIGMIPNDSDSSIFCDEYASMGLLSGSYVIRHREYQAAIRSSTVKSARSNDKEEWAFATLLGCSTVDAVKTPKEEIFYIPTNAPTFAIPFPLRDYVAKLNVDKNLQFSATISPK